MYQPAAGAYEFGDVFSAAWMFDIYVRGDAVPLAPFEHRDGPSRSTSVAYQRAAISKKRDLVLAHGKPHRAVLLSDGCEIESVIDRRTTGRLIFAAIDAWPSDPATAQRQLDSEAFGRHPLPPGDGIFDGGVANLESLFAVGRDAIVGAVPDPRVVRLDDAAALDLEIRWNAYAARRGPLAHRNKAIKLSMMLTADGDADLFRSMRDRDNPGRPVPEDLDSAACSLLAETLVIAWDLEGGVLNDMSDACERHEHPDASRDRILACLETLRDKAESARRALEATRRPAAGARVDG